MPLSERVRSIITSMDLDLLASERTNSDGESPVERMTIRHKISSLHPKNHALDTSIEKLETDRLMSTIRSTPIRRPGVLEASKEVLYCPRIVEYARLIEWYRRKENAKEKPNGYLDRRLKNVRERIKNYVQKNLDMELCETDIDVAVEYILTRSKG